MFLNTPSPWGGVSTNSLSLGRGLGRGDIMDIILFDTPSACGGELHFEFVDGHLLRIITARIGGKNITF